MSNGLPRHGYQAKVAYCLVATALCPACHRSEPPAAEAPASVPLTPTESAVVPAKERTFQVLDSNDGPDRWLFVVRPRSESAGGWATGTFDRPHNKIEVRTRDVQRFALFLDRIPIDWEKLVVLAIDGKNAELRRRDHARIELALDEHGQWIVEEHKAGSP